MASAFSTPNIAFVKYWGNRDDTLRIPAADSLSMTLDSPTVEVTVESAEMFSVHSERELTTKDLTRFQKHWKLSNTYLKPLTTYHLPLTTITIRSRIPPGIGLASSAAVFSALSCAYAQLLKEEYGITLSDQQISVLARLGSGSATRSVYGGFVALQTCHTERSRSVTRVKNPIEDAKAIQIVDEHYWPLHDIIIAPSLDEKKTGSTEGHTLAYTSPFFENRLRTIPHRMAECTDAILSKDFEKLQHITEEDAWDLHRVAETSTPPLQYLSEETHRITREITDLRKREHLAVLYTMDAGPTVHLVCIEDAVETIKEFAHTQKDCTVFETKIGRGATVQSPAHIR